MVLPPDLIAAVTDLPTVLIVGVALLIVAFSPRRSRAVVIAIAQYAAFAALALAAVAAGRQGYAMGAEFGKAQSLNDLAQFNFALAGAAIGALLGFAAGSLVVAIFFAVLDIREGTRR